jgi:serine-type D-Ala-D-Ala carboxypeptidase/endopeptidase (penicillin-binding protein 4)
VVARARRAIAAGALASLALTACGGSTRHPVDPGAHTATVAALVPSAATVVSTPTTPVTTATVPVPRTVTVPRTVPTADPRSPALRHLQAVLVHAINAEGQQTGLLVYDMTGKQTLFSLRAGVGRPPASVEKIYTTIAATTLLGPEAELHTIVLGSGHLAAHGVWRGSLYLRGDGDPTFGDGGFNRAYEDGYGPTAAQLIAQLKADGIKRVSGKVIADETRFDTDRGGPATANQPDVPDYGGQLSALVFDHGSVAKGLTPATFAAHELAITMRAEGVKAWASTKAGKTPPSARQLAVVVSPPLSVLLRLMDVPSDDLIADLLTKQLGFHFTGHGTLAAGAAQIRSVLSDTYQLEPKIYDGSGLDKADRSSPQQIVALLREVWQTPPGEVLAAALPVVGRSGTVQTLGLHTPAAGNCIAKTGTLNDVTNLAGYCNAIGGHELAFAIFIDGPGNWQALTAISHLVGAIASY